MNKVIRKMLKFRTISEIGRATSISRSSLYKSEDFNEKQLKKINFLNARILYDADKDIFDLYEDKFKQDLFVCLADISATRLLEFKLNHRFIPQILLQVAYSKLPNKKINDFYLLKDKETGFVYFEKCEVDQYYVRVMDLFGSQLIYNHRNSFEYVP